MTCLGFHGYRIGLALLLGVLACEGKTLSGDTDATDATSSASTGPTTGPTTSSASADSTTGDAELMCDIDFNVLYPDEGMFAIFHVQAVNEPCTLDGVDDSDDGLQLFLHCPEYEAKNGHAFGVRIERGPRPEALPAAGAVLDVFAFGFDPGYPYTSHAWLTLRSGDTLVYAVTQGEALMSDLIGPDTYSPFAFTRLDECPFMDAGDTGVVDATLICDFGARSRLAVLVDGEEELVMSEGETSTVLADDIPYAIEVVAVRRLKDCLMEQPVAELVRYDFAIAAQNP